MIYKEKPTNFNPRFNVVGCFIEYNKEILLLLRQDSKPEPNTWCIPWWKVNTWENNIKAIIREVFEETSLKINPSKLEYFKKLFVKYNNYDFIYHIYYTKLNKKLKILLNFNEHKDFKWDTPKNALKYRLIQDWDACIKLFFNL